MVRATFIPCLKSAYLQYSGCLHIAHDVQREVGDGPGGLVLGLAVVGPIVLHPGARDQKLAPRLPARQDLVPTNHSRSLNWVGGRRQRRSGRSRVSPAAAVVGRCGRRRATAMPSVLVELKYV